MSDGEIILCKRKEKHKINKRSVFLLPYIVDNNDNMAQIKALSKDGEKPANQTKKIKAIILIM